MDSELESFGIENTAEGSIVLTTEYLEGLTSKCEDVYLSALNERVDNYAQRPEVLERKSGFGLISPLFAVVPFGKTRIKTLEYSVSNKLPRGDTTLITTNMIEILPSEGDLESYRFLEDVFFDEYLGFTLPQMGRLAFFNCMCSHGNEKWYKGYIDSGRLVVFKDIFGKLNVIFPIYDVALARTGKANVYRKLDRRRW